MADELYLGDGAYVSFEGYAFKLRAPRANGDDEVWLEPDMLDTFVRYAMQYGYQPPRVEPQ